jgi:hypothetical protein
VKTQASRDDQTLLREEDRICDFWDAVKIKSLAGEGYEYQQIYEARTGGWFA